LFTLDHASPTTRQRLDVAGVLLVTTGLFATSSLDAATP